MKKESKNLTLLNYNVISDVLFALETIIKLVRESCLNKECESIYYNLPEKMMIKLSNERNRYISILTLALENVNNLKNSLE